MEKTNIWGWSPEKILYVKTLQQLRVKVMLTLTGMSIFEVAVIYIFQSVMPLWLFFLIMGCLFANMLLIMALHDVYMNVKKKLDRI